MNDFLSVMSPFALAGFYLFLTRKWWKRAKRHFREGKYYLAAGTIFLLIPLPTVYIIALIEELSQVRAFLPDGAQFWFSRWRWWEVKILVVSGIAAGILFLLNKDDPNKHNDNDDGGGDGDNDSDDDWSDGDGELIPGLVPITVNADPSANLGSLSGVHDTWQEGAQIGEL